MPLIGFLLLYCFFCFRLNSLFFLCLSFHDCKCGLVSCSKCIRCRVCTNNSYQEAVVWSWVTQLIPGKVADLSLSLHWAPPSWPSFPGCFLEELITDDKVLDKHGVLNGIWWGDWTKGEVLIRRGMVIYFWYLPWASMNKVFPGYRHTEPYTNNINYSSNWHYWKLGLL